MAELRAQAILTITAFAAPATGLFSTGLFTATFVTTPVATFPTALTSLRTVALRTITLDPITLDPITEYWPRVHNGWRFNRSLYTLISRKSFPC